MLEPQTLRFLKSLKKNNNRDWFEAHRPQYEAARTDFSNFINLVIHSLQREDPALAGLEPRDCLFRINRDVRFSNDKSPYKTNFGASIKYGGKKSPYAGYYFHCEPGMSFVGGGLWMPGGPALKNLRQEIDYNTEEFLSLLHARDFRRIYGELLTDPEFRLSTMPRGYEKGHPAAFLLKLRCYIAERPVSDEELTKSSLHRMTIRAFQALRPLVNFINRSIDGD